MHCFKNWKPEWFIVNTVYTKMATKEPSSCTVRLWFAKKTCNTIIFSSDSDYMLKAKNKLNLWTFLRSGKGYHYTYMEF